MREKTNPSKKQTNKERKGSPPKKEAVPNLWTDPPTPLNFTDLPWISQIYREFAENFFGKSGLLT